MKEKPVVFVTGASSGMGEDFARAFLKEGYTVYGAARRVERMETLRESGMHALKMDITKEADIKSVVEAITKKHGGVDILVNNAGFGLYGAMEDTSMEDARYQFEVNFFGLARLTQLCLPYMREQRAGRIINISSMGGKIYTPLGSWYHGTKHALEGWSDCLRIELAPFNVQVVVIEPGGMLTEFGDVLRQPMLDRSGKGPYADMVHKLSKMTEKYEGRGFGSPPKVITRWVVKAAKVKKPRTRYVDGKFAKPMLFVRKWFGDRAFDKLVTGMIK